MNDNDDTKLTEKKRKKSNETVLKIYLIIGLREMGTYIAFA